MPQRQQGLCVVYIGGYGRSGSTLLDQLVARRVGALSGGELWRLFEWACDGKPCTCGLRLNQCPVWSLVLDAVSDATGVPPSEVAARCRAVELAGAQDEIWEEAWRAVLRALLDLGITTLVDSSKTSAGHRRFQLLTTVPEVHSSFFIHLHRGLPAVINSRRRGSNVQMEFGGAPARTGVSSIRAVIGWVRANLSARRQARLATRAGAISYEDLTQRDGALERCLAELRIDVSGSAMQPEMLFDHAIGGNRMIRGGWSGQVIDDSAWRQELPWYWFALGAVVQAVSTAAGIVPGRPGRT